MAGMSELTRLADGGALAAAHRAGARDAEATRRAALIQAEAIQRRYGPLAVLDREARGGDGPLAGVPVTVKDILDVAGLPTRWGSASLAEARPAIDDAVAVARLRAAGACILGKTTTSDFASTPLGHSTLTGLTRNPWNEAITCGGSSAGAGVAVVTGIAPIALATDAGCSTRLPAAFAGVFGLKPTLGRIPHPGVPEGFANFIHLGLLAATVRDVALALSVVAGPHPADPHSLAHAPMGPVPAPSVAGARVLVWMTTGNRAVSAEVASATRAAAALLGSLGARVEERHCAVDNPDAAWRVLQQSNWAARFGAQTAEQRAALPPALARGVDEALRWSALDLQRALVRRTALFRAVQAEFTRGVDFILTPCCAAVDVPAEQDPLGPLVVDGEAVGALRTEWTAPLSLFDLTGHPAIAMPAAMSRLGVPIGVQLVAGWGQEARLLAAAAAFEQVCPPPCWPGFAA